MRNIKDILADFRRDPGSLTAAEFKLVESLLRKKKGSKSGRERARESMARKRAAERDIELPAAVDPVTRAACEFDSIAFLSRYMPEKFDGAWTDDRREMVAAIDAVAAGGGTQAIAAARGDGKTSIVEGMIIKGLLYGHLRFPVIVAATGPNASYVLRNIKFEFETNDRLAADFPEVCVPIRSLEGANQRAGTQTVNGERTRMVWKADMLVFPTVNGSRASGSVLAARGLEGSIRGLRVRNLRPDFVLIDDPDTRESAGSQIQTESRSRTIEHDLAGLAGPSKKMSMVLLCTLLNGRCTGAVFTDRKLKPSWNGKRFRMVKEWPQRMDLWDDYMLLRQRSQREAGVDPRAADDFYIQHREAMDAGVSVSNGTRFVSDVQEDSRPKELSAIQHCFNFIADYGRDAFDCEYQNDPAPDDVIDERDELTPSMVMARVNSQSRGVVPPGCGTVTVGVDLRKTELHWAIVAFDAMATPSVIDYGVEPVLGTRPGTDVGLDDAITKALHDYRDGLMEREVKPSIVLVDSGYRPEAVYRFINEVGGKPYRAAKGLGSGKGMRPYPDKISPAPGLVAGHHWFAKQQADSRVWLHTFDADYWKRWVQDRLNSKPGLTLWGAHEERKQHEEFANHLLAEKEIQRFDTGTRGWYRQWIKQSPHNHWLDCVIMACCAATMAGMKPLPPVRSEEKEDLSKSVTKSPIGRGPVISTPGFVSAHRNRY